MEVYLGVYLKSYLAATRATKNLANALKPVAVDNKPALHGTFKSIARPY